MSITRGKTSQQPFIVVFPDSFCIGHLKKRNFSVYCAIINRFPHEELFHDWRNSVLLSGSSLDANNVCNQ